jgi:hypothetical protein
VILTSAVFWFIVQCDTHMCVQDYRKFNTKQKCEAQAIKDMEKNHTDLKCVQQKRKK